MTKSPVPYLFLLAILLHSGTAVAEQPVAMKFDRTALEQKWQERLRGFLAKGTIPLIDLESSLRKSDGQRHLKNALPVMDRLGIALIAFDGHQAPKSSGSGKGYRWSYYVHSVVNAHPDRFILATNGGNNPNWFKGKGGKPHHFIDQTEQQMRSGAYPIMGEFEFRHYMSNHQCKTGKTNRDIDVSLDSANAHRLFRLSEETGVAFLIHHEPEDALIEPLEKMLRAYPRAKVIWAHFGQVRKPGLSKSFGPALVERLLAAYPNLYFDLATARPNQKYACTKLRGYAVIWAAGPEGQISKLKPVYKAILSKYSTRFVVGLDYGGGRAPLPNFLTKKTSNVRNILRGLSIEAQHNIAYRNAWRLLTGRSWTQ